MEGAGDVAQHLCHVILPHGACDAGVRRSRPARISRRRTASSIHPHRRRRLRGPPVGEAHGGPRYEDARVAVDVRRREALHLAGIAVAELEPHRLHRPAEFWLTVTAKVAVAPTFTGDVAVKVTSGADDWTATTVDPVLRPPLVSSTVAVTVNVPPLR